MGERHEEWHPEGYLDWVRHEIADYDRVQDELVDATRRTFPSRILDLGTGSGETARRLLEAHPEARIACVDASEAMLGAAREVLGDRATFHVSQLEAELPEGPFTLVTSAFAIHHLPAAEKERLFVRVAEALRPGGRFVVGDDVLTGDPAKATVELSDYDRPSSLADQLDWLTAAGLRPRVCWSERDLAVIAADKL